jgi:hypothetical protein
MKIDELAALNALLDRFDKSLDTLIKASQQEQAAQRAFILQLVEAGSKMTLKGINAAGLNPHDFNLED